MSGQGNAPTRLSAYQIMWMLVMFDLPVMEPKERKEATRFRNFLLDQGFEMAQYSVYMRFCKGKEQVEVYARRIERNLPSGGKINMIAFTDKQYENIRTFHGQQAQPGRKSPGQLTLF